MGQPTGPTQATEFCLDCQRTYPARAVAHRVRINLGDDHTAVLWHICPGCGAPNRDVLDLTLMVDKLRMAALCEYGAQVTDNLTDVLTDRHGLRFQAELENTVCEPFIGVDAPMYDLMPHLEAENAAWGWTA